MEFEPASHFGFDRDLIFIERDEIWIESVDITKEQDTILTDKP